MSHREGGGTERGNVNYPYILAKVYYIKPNGFSFFFFVFLSVLEKWQTATTEVKFVEFHIPSGGHETQCNQTSNYILKLSS